MIYILHPIGISVTFCYFWPQKHYFFFVSATSPLSFLCPPNHRHDSVNIMHSGSAFLLGYSYILYLWSVCVYTSLRELQLSRLLCYITIIFSSSKTLLFGWPCGLSSDAALYTRLLLFLSPWLRHHHRHHPKHHHGNMPSSLIEY